MHSQISLFVTEDKAYEIRVFHDDAYVDYSLLECDAVQSGTNLPSFRRNLPPLSSTLNVDKSLPDYMKSHPRNPLSPTDRSVLFNDAANC
jgi:hypothetical protein